MAAFITLDSDHFEYCSYHELAKDIKHNKGGILRASVTFVKILKSDQLKKQRLEEICRLQHEQLGAVMDKIRVRYLHIIKLCHLMVPASYEFLK